MSFDFAALSANNKYKLLQEVVERVWSRDENGDDYRFRSDDMHVNLLGVRGFEEYVPKEPEHDEYDDMMFVVRSVDGIKEVREFQMSAEYGDTGTAVLKTGQHKYKLGTHGESHKNKVSRADLGDTSRWQDVAGHYYRALEPASSVQIFRDSNRNLQQGETEHDEFNTTINIHWGGENSVGSAGCQVIRHWTDYKEFIRLVEEDHSIQGTIENELADVPGEDGDRSVIYTLVSGEFVEEVYHQLFGASLPVDLGEGLEVTPEAIEHAYRIIETGPGGYFPVGAEQVWHGGVHLPTPGGADQLVHAPLPGRVVAARLDASAGRRNNHYGSSRFVLLAHDPAALLGPHVPDVEDPFDGETLFSLLMHLGPPEGDLGGEIPAEHDLAWLRGAPTAYRATSSFMASPTPGLTSADPETVGDIFGWATGAFYASPKLERTSADPGRIQSHNLRDLVLARFTPGFNSSLRSFFLLLAISVTLTLGCTSEPQDSTSADTSNPNRQLPSEGVTANASTHDESVTEFLPEQNIYKDTTCVQNQVGRSNSKLRRYVWLQNGEYKKVAATSDSIGLVLTDLFSPPGQWSFESVESGWADGLLRYHCYVGIRGYESCGQPESVGNPPEYDGPEDVFLYFKYRLDLSTCTSHFTFYKNHESNSEGDRAYLLHHGVLPDDTLSLSLKKLDLR